jgi:lipopolysaccharide/colanic/teichoic acid biosynthesis glycosyltransferase
MIVAPTDAVALLVPLLSEARQVAPIVGSAGLGILLIAAAGRYRRRLHLSVLDELPAIVGRLIVATALVAMVMGVRGDAVAPLLRNAPMVIVLVLGGRVLTNRLLAWSRDSGRAMHPTVVIGGGALVAEIVDLLDSQREYGLAVVGFVDDDRGRAASHIVPWLGPVSKLDSVVLGSGVDTVLVVGGGAPECAVAAALRTAACLGCDVFAVPALHHLHLDPAPVDRIGSVAVVRVLRPNLTGAARAARRAIDVAIAGLALALLSPVFVVRVLTRRVRGERGTPLGLWSLLRMLRGELGLVGPQADRPDHTDGFSARYECYRLRTRARAGLTGLAQVNGVGGYSTHERARYDNRYIETWSPWLDLKILVAALAQRAAGREP